MLDKINNRLDIALNNLNNDNFEELFPIILDDLEYILSDYKKDKEKLTSVEQFMHGIEFHDKIVLYYIELSKIYMKKIYGIDLTFVETDDYSFATAGGGYNAEDDKIYYSKFGSTLAQKSDLTFLHVCLHEARHKMQHDTYTSNDIFSFPSYMIRFLKEVLLENSLQENNRKFYTDNYEMLFIENDAEIFAKKEISILVYNLYNLYINLYNKTSSELNGLLQKVNRVNELFDEVLQKEDYRINTDIEQQVYSGDLLGHPYKISNQEFDRVITLDKFIKNHPELQEKYPILKLLFNGNIPKTYEEIIGDKNSLKQNKTALEQNNIDKLYDEIIALNPILYLTEKLENGDIDSCKAYIELHPTILSEYDEDINILFEKYGNFTSHIK